MPHSGLYTGLQAQICVHPEPRSPKSCLLGAAQPLGGLVSDVWLRVLDSPISLVFELPVGGVSCQVGVP